MKWFFGNAISFFNHVSGSAAAPESEPEPDLILSGYAFTDDYADGAAPGTDCGSRRQSGLLYADIADYARLAGLDDTDAQERLGHAIKKMMANVAANNGRIVHLAGAALLAEFGDADSALHCAINVQLATRQWNATLAAENQVKFRIGVGIGDAISDRHDIQFRAAELAARLEKLACSGGICVSESLGRELGAHPSFKFVPMGKKYVKDIDQPVQAFWIEIDSQRVVDPENTGSVKITALAS